MAQPLPDKWATVQYPEELKQLHENLIDFYLNIPVDTTQVGKSLTEIDENGTWRDIDYTNTQRGNWPVMDHLSNLRAMAIAYRTNGSPFYNQKNVSVKIHLALDNWLRNDYLSTNWWHQHIGVPKTMMPTLFLMEAELIPKQLQQAMVLLNRAKIKMTGQNKVWLSGNVLFRSLLNRDSDSIAIASKSIQEELIATDGEGIQYDWSYHQHGPQLQFGNYGLSYLEDMVQWFTVLNNTPFNFEDNKIAILRNYLLEGQRWVSWKDKIDISACGRQLFIDEPTKKALRLNAVMQKMAVLDEPYAMEYKKATDYETLVGDKHFWKSDFHVHRNKNYYFSVKMASKRVLGAETVNLENIQGYHMGDGVTFLYQSPKDYDNVFPFWNWRKLPGTTIIQDTVPLSPLTAWGYHIDSNFVGGVSDGINGIAVMDYNRDGLQAHKSWFMFDDKIVCLGSGITASTDFPVNTTVDQTFLKEDLFIGESDTITESTKKTLEGPDWIVHNKTGYLFDNAGKMGMEARYIEGSWANVAKRYRPIILVEKIFRLWFDHGANPTDNTYEYIIVPHADRETMNELKQHRPFEISNSKNLQTVISKDGNLAGTIFYKAGKATIFGGIEVNHPCVMMLKRENEGLKVSVSDPTHQLTEVVLIINGVYKGKNVTQQKDGTHIKIALPLGKDAGKTVSLLLKK